jgi:hypothetical protein
MAGSVALDSSVVGVDALVGAAFVNATTVETMGLERAGVAIAGTANRSCEPPANCIVESGSERLSPEFSRDTNMPGSKVSMWVKLLERPWKEKKENSMRK